MLSSPEGCRRRGGGGGGDLVKNIIVCCDGTGNEFESNVTNVVETYALATKNAQQLVFYDPGVGTGGWQYDEGTGKLRAAKDLATGGGLQKNIEGRLPVSDGCV